MNLLTILTIGFLTLEAANVIALYFFPGSKYVNATGVFILVFGAAVIVSFIG